MSIHVDCQNCGRVVKLSDRGASGKCKCGTQLRLVTSGNTISIDHHLAEGRRGASRNKSSKRSQGRGRSSSRAMKSVKSLLVNFLAVMIFVSVAVILLARLGG